MEPPGEATEGEFFPIHLATMQPGTLAPVDLYIKTRVRSPAILYRAAHTPFTEETRRRLLDRGVESLHLHNKDKQAYNEYVEQNLATIIRDSLLPPGKACQLVYDSSSRVMQDVLADPRSGKNLQRASNMAETVVLAIIKSRDALWNMTALATHDYFTYTHSVHVCAFLVATSRDLLGVREPAALERIGFGGMLHDLGKSRVPKEILRKPGKLTEAEFEIVKRHPVAGIELLEYWRKVPATAASIIRSHHERFDGHGYPDGLVGERTRPVARLAKIIDVYDALTTERPCAPARKSFDALTVMKKMDGHFDVPLLDSFVKFLGPEGLRTQDPLP